MKVGIVTTWFERGASYVSMQYQELLEHLGHEVFIFSRGKTHDSNFGNTKNVFRAKPLPAPYPDKFDQDIFAKWLTDNEIETVLFNEQKEMSPIVTCNKLNIKTGAYVDYYTEKTVKLFWAYDFLVCNTKMHYSVFKNHPQAFYLPWGTNVDLFKPKSFDLVEKQIVTFFHSCGFSYYRKGTDLLINAFYEMQNTARLIIHAQIDLFEDLPKDCAKKLKELVENNKCEVISETVSAPGLYHLGDIYVYPSRLDGLGLTMAEALLCGLQLVIPDIQPMNEFGGKYRKLVKIAKTFKRNDDYYWPMNEIDHNDLVNKLDEFAVQSKTITKQKKETRKFALDKLDWSSRGSQIQTIFIDSKILNSKEKENILNEITSSKNLWNNKGLNYKIYSMNYRLYILLSRIFSK